MTNNERNIRTFGLRNYPPLILILPCEGLTSYPGKQYAENDGRGLTSINTCVYAEILQFMPFYAFLRCFGDDPL